MSLQLPYYLLSALLSDHERFAPAGVHFVYHGPGFFIRHAHLAGSLGDGARLVDQLQQLGPAGAEELFAVEVDPAADAYFLFISRVYN